MNVFASRRLILLSSLHQPVMQPSQTIPMMLKSREDDEEDYDEDD